jgi:NADP-dependent 3-hydroxy acid dehydrogenase YdfG
MLQPSVWHHLQVRRNAARTKLTVAPTGNGAKHGRSVELFGGGRIINNGSVSAHVPRRNSTAHVATKHGLTGLTRSLSLDGREYDIACGQIDIGNAATTRNEDTARGRLQASGKIEPEARIDVNDVARGVSYMASLPLEANVQFMTVMATKMPYIGRG